MNIEGFGSVRYLVLMNPDPGESQKDTDPMDPDPAPDPQHWLKVACNEKVGVRKSGKH